MDERRAPLSDAETETLKALWDHGPGSVRQINDFLKERGKNWAYSTVITLLNRLERKGYVAVDKRSFAHVFHAALSRDDLVRQRLNELAEELCEGEPGPLVLAFAQRHSFTDEEIQIFQDMIERWQAKRKKRKPGK